MFECLLVCLPRDLARGVVSRRRRVAPSPRRGGDEGERREGEPLPVMWPLHTTYASSDPSADSLYMQEIFAAAFASIRKAELAEKAATVVEDDVWIADARALDDILLVHRKQRAQGEDDTSWAALFGTLVKKDVMPESARMRVKDAVAAALDDAFRPLPPPPPEAESQEPNSLFTRLQQGALKKQATEEAPLPFAIFSVADTVREKSTAAAQRWPEEALGYHAYCNVERVAIYRFNSGRSRQAVISARFAAKLDGAFGNLEAARPKNCVSDSDMSNQIVTSLHSRARRMRWPSSFRQRINASRAPRVTRRHVSSLWLPSFSL